MRQEAKHDAKCPLDANTENGTQRESSVGHWGQVVDRIMACGGGFHRGTSSVIPHEDEKAGEP